MREKFIVWLTIGSLVGLLFGCSGQPRPIPLGTDTYYYGYINTGQKFGVRIGQSREDAKQTLYPKKAYFGGVISCDHPRLKETIDCTSNEKIDVYLLKWNVLTFRAGQVYLFIKEDKVTTIVWSLHPLPAIAM